MQRAIFTAVPPLFAPALRPPPHRALTCPACFTVGLRHGFTRISGFYRAALVVYSYRPLRLPRIIRQLSVRIPNGLLVPGHRI